MRMGICLVLFVFHTGLLHLSTSLVLPILSMQIILQFSWRLEGLCLGVPFALGSFMYELLVHKLREEVLDEEGVDFLVSQVTRCEGCNLFCETCDEFFSFQDVRVYRYTRETEPKGTC